MVKTQVQSPAAPSPALPGRHSPETPQVHQDGPGNQANLNWWLCPHCLDQGSLIKIHYDVVIHSDASLLSWEAHADSQVAQGRWSPLKLTCFINFLELRTIFLALKNFKTLVRGRDVLVYTNNTMAKSYINQQGGTWATSLQAEAR